MHRRVSAMERVIENRAVEALVKDGFEEETAQMLKLLAGNVSEPTLRHVEEIIERYKAERWPAWEENRGA